MSAQDHVRHKSEFKIWKTITLGSGIKNAHDLGKAINNAGMSIAECSANIMLDSTFTVAKEATEVDLVVAFVGELGFKKYATLEKIYQRAKERGLQLCPAEVGPVLRLTYQDQPPGEYLIIGMEPIHDLFGLPNIFRVQHFCVDYAKNYLLLSCHCGGPYHHLAVDERFVFVRPRKPACR